MENILKLAQASVATGFTTMLFILTLRRVLKRKENELNKNIQNYNVGTKRKIISEICLLKSYLIKLLKIYQNTQNNRKKFLKINKPTKQIKTSVVISSGPCAFKRRISSIIITNITIKRLDIFLKKCYPAFKNKLIALRSLHGMLKVNCVLSCAFLKTNLIDDNDEEIRYFTTANFVYDAASKPKPFFFKNFYKTFFTEISEFEGAGSGYHLNSIISLTVNYNKYQPLHAGKPINLPAFIERKHACINIQNVDDKMCFVWSVLSCLFPAKSNPSRLSHYRDKLHHLNLKGICFPFRVSQVEKFERQNRLSINIFVILQSKRIGAIKLTKNFIENRHINLLMIGGKDGQPHHFVWIKHFSRLFRSALTKHNGAIATCYRCGRYFHESSKLDVHVKDCTRLNQTIPRFPKLGEEKMMFKNYSHQLKKPYVIYADIECTLQKQNKKNELQIHNPCAIGFHYINPEGSQYRCDISENCISWFVNELESIAKQIRWKIDNPLPMKPLTLEQMKQARTATVCHICKKELIRDRNDPRYQNIVFDHNHNDSLWRGKFAF